MASSHGQQEVAGDEDGVEIDHAPVQQEPADFTDFHEYQLLADGERKPLKIPHNLENGPIILYPSRSNPP